MTQSPRENEEHVFLLNSGSQILLVHCYRGTGEQFHPWNRLETRTFLVDTIDTYWYHHYIVWLPTWTGPSSKRFKFYFRNSDHKMFEVWKSQSQFQNWYPGLFFGWIIASSLETIWRCHYRTFNNDKIEPLQRSSFEGHCGPPTLRWNVLVRATLLTGVWGEGKVSFGESMGKVYFVGRYSVVETIQIKLVGSTLERQPAMIFFWKDRNLTLLWSNSPCVCVTCLWQL